MTGPPGSGSAGAHLLLVEDDDAMRGTVAANLVAHGYRIVEAPDVAEAIRRWDAERPDVVLLDLGLPDGDGTAIIRRVRREATTPILVLSARGAEPDKVAALEAGADDYVTKPFGLGELRARIAALLRRTAGPAADASGTIRHGPLTIDPGRRIASVDGEPLDLTPREYELLRTMLSQPGRLLTKARLLRAVWGTAYADEGHYLHVYVSRLRRKLAAADRSGSLRELIVAEPGVGYRIGEPSAEAAKPRD
ncbi:MAG TPA: response regulator transcription factor [Candidatus Limnocylindrales bacterium]|jgi:two-component system KDP operon response regulator KdpE|nr:response regulator transcription factor [Candidatus Limnocylindrales bacterium]